MNHFNTNHLTTSLLKSQPAFRSKRTRFSFTFKFVLLVIALCANCFMTQIANAQAPTLEWVKSMGGSGNDDARSITVDASGNLYTTGQFSGTVDFNPGPGVFNLTSGGGGINLSAFISKLDAAGNFMWAKSLNGEGIVEGVSIAIDGVGNVYTAGHFDGFADFDPGVGIFNLISMGDEDIYISKLNASGNFMWAKKIGGISFDFLASLKLDAAGNVITAGRYSGTVDFDPNAGVFNLTQGSGIGIVYSTFISKLDANGNFIWAKSMIGTDVSTAYSIALDTANNIYIAGSFRGTVDFDPNAGIANLTAAGTDSISDGYISKLDAAGNYVWAKRIGDNNSEIAETIGVDALGNVYTTGWYSGTVDFDPNAGIFTQTSSGGYNMYILKLDAAGDFIWAKSLQTNAVFSDEYVWDFAIDDLNNLYCTGYFLGTVDFNPNAGIFNLVSAADVDIFILKLDALGNFVWAKSMGGLGMDYAYSIALDAARNVYTTGFFTNTVDFNPDAGVVNVTSNGGADIFIHKMSPCVSPPAPSNTSASSATTICYGATTTLSVSAAGTAGWYSAATGGTYLGGGNSFTTPPLLATTIFYVQDSTCTPSATRTPITVTVRPIFLSGSTSASPSAICLEESTNLTYTAPSCYSNPNFEYTYAPANWVLNQSPANANGTVNTTNAPSSITMVSSNGSIGLGAGTTSYSITIPCSRVLFPSIGLIQLRMVLGMIIPAIVLMAEHRIYLLGLVPPAQTIKPALKVFYCLPVKPSLCKHIQSIINLVHVPPSLVIFRPPPFLIKRVNGIQPQMEGHSLVVV
ncbi:MAG: SBBP repeat-containing protein [Bacteroidetes bacterium]|nr:SBBP repeat-containing protein [Bacteroidota bacterium]